MLARIVLSAKFKTVQTWRKTGHDRWIVAAARPEHVTFNQTCDERQYTADESTTPTLQLCARRVAVVALFALYASGLDTAKVASNVGRNIGGEREPFLDTAATLIVRTFEVRIGVLMLGGNIAVSFRCCGVVPFPPPVVVINIAPTIAEDTSMTDTTAPIGPLPPAREVGTSTVNVLVDDGNAMGTVTDDEDDSYVPLVVRFDVGWGRVITDSDVRTNSDTNTTVLTRAVELRRWSDELLNDASSDEVTDCRNCSVAVTTAPTFPSLHVPL